MQENISTDAAESFSRDTPKRKCNTISALEERPLVEAVKGSKNLSLGVEAQALIMPEIGGFVIGSGAHVLGERYNRSKSSQRSKSSWTRRNQNGK